MSMRVSAEASLNPTEDESKVTRALLNIFPDAKVEKVSKADGVGIMRLHGSGLSFLATFRSLIKQERIRGAARKVILAGTESQRIMIYLHKQAAFAGRVSFCAPFGESPQGPITVRIDTASPELVVDYLASQRGQGGFQRFRET
ncbi:MAG: RNA-binding domain-containing protein [Candidatus Bathyarchaeia archaeon]|jgi:predicted RNA binding protein with dsRBD fold (UPF0201 family)